MPIIQYSVLNILSVTCVRLWEYIYLFICYVCVKRACIMYACAKSVQLSIDSACMVSFLFG